MMVEVFLTLLSVLSTVNGFVVEGIKNSIGEKVSLPYNLVALISGLIIGCGGCFTFYIIKGYPINYLTAIYCILMGFATSLTSMVGFDKIKQLIFQIKL